MRDCRLECVQAVIERQKRMPAEANDDRLFLDRQHRRSRFLWSRPSVHDRAARLPLAHRLLIDAVTSGERSQALFTMLYRSTDRLSRRGAPVKNLAHSASFDSCRKNAPSKCETKHLGTRRLNPPARVSRNRKGNLRCSETGQVLCRIHGGRALTQLEVQLRRRDIAGLAGLCDRLTALHRIAALYFELAIVGIGRHEAVGVADEDEIAVALELAAGIGDYAVIRRFHGRAFGHRDVDAVIAAEAADDAAARRPA